MYSSGTASIDDYIKSLRSQLDEIPNETVVGGGSVNYSNPVVAEASKNMSNRTALERKISDATKAKNYYNEYGYYPSYFDTSVLNVSANPTDNWRLYTAMRQREAANPSSNLKGNGTNNQNVYTNLGNGQW